MCNSLYLVEKHNVIIYGGFKSTALLIEDRIYGVELDSSLVVNNNINFRNELLHGLMEMALLKKYVQYVC